MTMNTNLTNKPDENSNADLWKTAHPVPNDEFTKFEGLASKLFQVAKEAPSSTD